MTISEFDTILHTVLDLAIYRGNQGIIILKRIQKTRCQFVESFAAFQYKKK